MNLKIKILIKVVIVLMIIFLVLIRYLCIRLYLSIARKLLTVKLNFYMKVIKNYEKNWKERHQLYEIEKMIFKN